MTNSIGPKLRTLTKYVEVVLKLAFVLLYLSPLYILFVISVKSPKEFAETLYSFPNRIEIDNYLFALNCLNFHAFCLTVY